MAREIYRRVMPRIWSDPDIKKRLSRDEKAFLLYLDSCHICSTCSGSEKPCFLPKQARPTPEALGVDVFATVRQIGYPIAVLSDYDQTMNRYAFLLIE